MVEHFHVSGLLDAPPSVLNLVYSSTHVRGCGDVDTLSQHAWGDVLLRRSWLPIVWNYRLPQALSHSWLLVARMLIQVDLWVQVVVLGIVDVLLVVV